LFPVEKYFTFDQFASRKSIEYSKREISDAEKKILVGSIHVEANRNKEALEVLAEAEHSIGKLAIQNLEEEVGTLFFMKGKALRCLERFAEAMQEFEKVIAMENSLKKREIYLVPHSMVEMAEIQMEKKNWEEAEKILRIAHDNYS
jgi:tetratricopeptide (TPR) repeat protein